MTGSDATIDAGDICRSRETTAKSLFAAAVVAVIGLAFVSMATGATGISLSALPAAISAALGRSDNPTDVTASLVLLELRLPRTILAMFVGAALALAGSMMQGLFRNPLADPGLVGVSSGATLAAVCMIVLGNSVFGGWYQALGIFALPIAAFAGGLIATFALMAIASRHGATAIATLLLAGIALGALTGAVTGILSYISDDRELRDLTLWSMGSLSGASWPKVVAITPFALALLVTLPSLVRALNGLLLGEAEAFHLGIDIERAKKRIVLLTAAAVGAAVAVAGIIGFVGIVVPHFVRMIAGPDHRTLLPISALLGGALVMVADVIARIVVAPAELPIGIIMAVIGAPVFLHLVLKRSSGVVM